MVGTAEEDESGTRVDQAGGGQVICDGGGPAGVSHETRGGVGSSIGSKKR
jgi:hypothetical protein